MTKQQQQIFSPNQQQTLISLPKTTTDVNYLTKQQQKLIISPKQQQTLITSPKQQQKLNASTNQQQQYPQTERSHITTKTKNKHTNRQTHALKKLPQP